MDLNLGDIDPNTGNLLMGQPISHGMQQLRGRGASQGSIGSNGRLTGPSSVANGGLNGIAQRPMNLWMNPITIEQVVKRLATELKQAKQQSHDLHRTGDFFSTLLTLNPGDEMPKPPEGRVMQEYKQPNGISPVAPLVEGLSPFSQPPAPPPQQPLPEKPDAARITSSESLSQPPLRRTDTERPGSFSNSPTRLEPHSSQILSLVEALNLAKKEIDSQGDRVKQLESLLKREKKARESAEERARRLMAGRSSQDDERGENKVEKDSLQPSLDAARETHSEGEPDIISTSTDDQSDTTMTSATSESTDELHRQTVNVDASTSRLQKRLDQMLREMDQMKAQMESYKRRAEGAESERASLADMIESIRAEAAGQKCTMNGNMIYPMNHTSIKSPAGASLPPLDQPRQTSGLWNGTSSSPSSPSSSLHNRKPMNGTITASGTKMDKESPTLQALERNMAATLQSFGNGGSTAQSRGGRDVAMQSAPYVSMVGVVLIGVGIMTWLNGWQKGDR